MMKKLIISFILLITLILNLFFLQGCNNNSNPEKTESTINTNAVGLENTTNLDSVEIKRVPSKSLNNQFIEEFNKAGAYLINSSNQQAIVLVGKENSIIDADAKIEGDTAIVNYYTDLNPSGGLSIYKDVFYISNCENIEFVNVFLNKKRSYFISSIISDRPIFK